MTSRAEYWDQRGRDFGGRGAGLRAVCSYGMPAFYNGYIHLTQQLALAPHLRVAPGTEVLDLGCGIGRWSRKLARRGARVVGVDVAQSMIDEARRRTAQESLDVEYRVGDLRTLDLGRTFELVLAVTVLQHIFEKPSSSGSSGSSEFLGFLGTAASTPRNSEEPEEPEELDRELSRALRNIARHLAPGGRAVLLEAAPSRPNATCDTHVFRARTAQQYLDAFRAAGLRAVRVTGVDPAPFKQRVLPRYRTMPRLAARAAMFAATALSLPFDALLGRRMAEASWHKVFLLEHDG